MFDALMDANPLLLDVTLIAILVLIVFFGVLKGITNTFISLLLFIISFLLGFTKYTNDLKIVLIKNILKIDDWMPAGSNSPANFVANLFATFLASLLLFVLFEIILFVIRILIGIMLNKKREEKPRKTVVSRVFGGLVSFVYGTVFVIAFLLVINNSVTGLNYLIKDSTIAKFAVNETEKMLNKKDVNTTDKLTLKVYLGDVFTKVDENVLKSYIYIEEKESSIIMNKKYIDLLNEGESDSEQMKQIIKDGIRDMYHLSIMTIEFNKTNPNITKKFASMAEDVLNAMDKRITDDYLGQIEFSINEKGKIVESLKKAGVKEEHLMLIDRILIGG